MKRLLLLDLDGTVVDTLSYIIRCFQQAVEPYTTHIPTSAEIVATFGPAEHECIRKVLQQHEQQGWLRQPYSESISQAAAQQFHQLYAAGYSGGQVQCYPGIREVIQGGKQQGGAIGIFTGKGRPSAWATLEHVQLLPAMDVIVTSDDVQEPKPAPEGVLLACDKTGVAPRQALFVGDNPADILAGRRAGVPTAAAMWGAVFPEETLAAQPDSVLADIPALQSLLVAITQQDRS
ncbi:MAG TPA: HAD-IA family hydrolase [Gemmatales bacterium]|nr:HAD-IA family hydrolase [Gemmatales bacterium]